MNNGMHRQPVLGAFSEALFLIDFGKDLDFICMQVEPKNTLIVDQCGECNSCSC
jgi:hypothetical protein